MPTYVLNFHMGPAIPPREESIEANDMAELRDLAEIWLLMNLDVTHVEVYSEGEFSLRLDRDKR